MNPATISITTAAQGCTQAQGAVIATRPATAPLQLILTSGLPSFLHVISIAITAPAAAAKFVFAIIDILSSWAENVEPG